MVSESPTCWKCGYALTGLRVDDVCPECGTPVWSSPPGPDVVDSAQRAMWWGVASLVLLFVCLGPLAGFVAIPAITNGRHALELERTGRIPASAVRGARTGLYCGWATVVLSVALAIVYLAMMFAAP